MAAPESQPPAVAPPAAPDEPQLSLADHFEELRRRLGVSLAALLVAVAVSWTQADRLIWWLQRPVEPLLPQFAFFTPVEPLTAYVKLAVLAGVVLAMPVFLWQAWAFVRTALTRRERAFGVLFVGWGTVQFLLGAALAYGVLLPVSLRVLFQIGEPVLEPVISIGAYVGFVTMLMIWTGLVFELPVVVFLLSRLGILTPEWLRQQRAYAILVLVIFAAIVTPTTDPVSLLLVAGPLILLYQASIAIARLGLRRREGLR